MTFNWEVPTGLNEIIFTQKLLKPRKCKTSKILHEPLNYKSVTNLCPLNANMYECPFDPFILTHTYNQLNSTIKIPLHDVYVYIT